MSARMKMNNRRSSTAVVLAIVFLAFGSVSNVAFAITVASDNASNPAYSDGWQAGDNGGTGFGAWTFGFSGTTSQLLHPPQFIANAPLAGNSLGAPAFALTTSDQRSAF